MPEQSTMTQLLTRLKGQGFTANLGVVEGCLRVLDTGRVLRTEDLVIREVHRFEGESDPDDMAVVYALESTDGTRGVLVDAFGIYADPEIGALLSTIPDDRAN